MRGRPFALGPRNRSIGRAKSRYGVQRGRRVLVPPGHGNDVPRQPEHSGAAATELPWCTETMLLVLLEAAAAAMRAHGAEESVQLAGCLLLKRVARAPRSSDLLLPCGSG